MDWNAAMDREAGDPAGPLVYTFAFPLPFTLGLTHDGIHFMDVRPPSLDLATMSPWRFADAAHQFGAVPTVRLRFCKCPTEGLQIIPRRIDVAATVLYGSSSHLSEANPLPYNPDGAAYEQWVSIETAGARLQWEAADDPAYAFHRAWYALSDFLASYIVAFGVLTVRPISTEDIGRLVLRGAYDRDGQWHALGPIIFHPERFDVYVGDRDQLAEISTLSNAVTMVQGQHPIVTTKLWRWRAKAAEQRGDTVDQVVGLQTSMETLLFSVWRMSMVDQNLTLAAINAAVDETPPFKSLLSTVMPRILGGRWNLAKTDHPVGIYWRDLYTIRNRIVHGGYVPSRGDAQAAENAYLAMRQFVNVRLWEKRRKYPRAMLTRLGSASFEGQTDSLIEARYRQLVIDAGPWWWLPVDVAKLYHQLTQPRGAS